MFRAMRASHLAAIDLATGAYGLTTRRLEGLSDGVLAIVITLLVLNFAGVDDNIPLTASGAELTQQLLALWPHLVGYVLTFVLVAIYWMLHHVIFHHVQRVDRTLLWLNVAFLLTVAFLPFPTELVADFIGHESNVIVVIYGAAHFLVGLSLVAIWWYATKLGRLVDPKLDPLVIRSTMMAVLIGPLCYLAGIGLSFASIPLGLCVYGLIPLLYMAPGQINRQLATLGVHDAQAQRAATVAAVVGAAPSGQAVPTHPA